MEGEKRKLVYSQGRVLFPKGEKGNQKIFGKEGRENTED